MNIPGLTISRAKYNLKNGEVGEIAVFIYSGKNDPRKILDSAVFSYVENNSYHELVDANLDNPWMRIVISDINNLSQEPFDSATHKMKNSNG